MFLVFNKDKMIAYGIAIITVILLFCAAGVMITDNKDIVLTGTSAGIYCRYIKWIQKKIMWL